MAGATGQGNFGLTRLAADGGRCDHEPPRLKPDVRPKHSNVELTFRIILTVVFTGVWLIVVRSVWTNQLDPRATIWFSEKTLAPPDWIATRDPNKLYQDSGRQG